MDKAPGFYAKATGRLRVRVSPGVTVLLSNGYDIRL